MDISDEKKIDILISALEERYESIHTIRERVQSICLWALGISITATGWLISTDIFFDFVTLFIYLLLLVVTYWILRWDYFADLEKGFKSQLKTAGNIENALRLYDKKYFTQEDISMYPEKWKTAGSEKTEGNFFTSHYSLLKFGFIILGLALILRTCF